MARVQVRVIRSKFLRNITESHKEDEYVDEEKEEKRIIITILMLHMLFWMISTHHNGGPCAYVRIPHYSKYEGKFYAQIF